jgi:hypothetical protein
VLGSVIRLSAPLDFQNVLRHIGQTCHDEPGDGYVAPATWHFGTSAWSLETPGDVPIRIGSGGAERHTCNRAQGD